MRHIKLFESISDREGIVRYLKLFESIESDDYYKKISKEDFLLKTTGSNIDVNDGIFGTCKNVKDNWISLDKDFMEKINKLISKRIGVININLHENCRKYYIIIDTSTKGQNYKRRDIKIIALRDSYFAVVDTIESFGPKNITKYYICDQYDGLKMLLHKI